MAIRRDATYISTDVWKALLSIAQAKSDLSNCEHIVTVDQLADDLLRETIAGKFPQIAEYEKEARKLETDLKAKLKAALMLADGIRKHQHE